MTRVKRGNVARKRRNKLLEYASGFRGSHSRLFRPANQQVMKAWVSSTRDNKRRKRYFRQLWITRINAAVRKEGMSYSQFIHKLYQANILINRKMFAQLAILDNDAFLNTLKNL